MDEIRIGVAGLGGRGVGWIRNLQRIPGFRITAICDVIEQRHARALEAIEYRDDVKAFTDWPDFLAYEGMEAVGLCVRCKEQGRMAAEALEAGKHVNCEVPAAHTLEDCWRIVTAAERRRDLVYQLAEQMRFAGYVDAWRELVQDGRLGHITYCEGEYFAYYPGLIVPETVPGTALPNWLHTMPAIHYLPHDLSPILKILDDRVVEVVGMATRPQSYRHPQVALSDMQVALMKTEKDCVLRLGVSFLQPGPPGDDHWLRLKGTKGILQKGFTPHERPKMWLDEAQMFGFAEVDWRYQRTDAPAAAAGSGHNDCDYYAQASFRDAVLNGTKPELDVYGAIDTAAPAILAADSIDQGSKPLPVPDFRPTESRAAGEMPGDCSQ